jgi:UDP-N-acetyl-D-glucosamine dehydrogenase
MTLSDRIEGRAAQVAVVGQGYLGLPLTVELARVGFRITGLETDPERVGARNATRGVLDAAGRIARL